MQTTVTEIHNADNPFFGYELKSKIFATTQKEHKKPKGNNVFEFEGDTFERLTRNEIIATEETKETEAQKTTRELLEDLYSDADSYLGLVNNSPSRPDGITLGYEKGKLVIKKIIEIKSSSNAMQSKLDTKTDGEEQPQKTLDTISSLVELLNRLISDEPLESILPKNKLDNVKTQTRMVQLSMTRSALRESGVTEQISFSENLEYIIILPKDVSTEGVEIDDDRFVLKYGNRNQNVPVRFDQSIFSKEDIKIATKHLQ